MTINFRYTVVALLLIIFNVQAQEDQKITTVEWRCYTQLDYTRGRVTKDFSRSKVIVQLSRTTEGNASEGTGAVTIGGVHFQGTFQFVGLDRVWEYESNGMVHGVIIEPTGMAFDFYLEDDGVRRSGSKFMCTSS